MTQPCPAAEISFELENAPWAAVSFVPEDQAWGEWIYRNLHDFSVPAQLVEETTMHGFPLPDCLAVFPDPGMAGFAGHYTKALAASRYLIVVCSPHSAHADLVDGHVRGFKRAGGEERIIVLVVEGGPDAGMERLARPAAPAWLPPWLDWRFQDGAFCTADRNEPQIVDARAGGLALRAVRDALLEALLASDAGRLEQLGALVHPLVGEVVEPAVPVIEEAPLSESFLPVKESRRSFRPAWIAAACAVVVGAGAAGWQTAQSGGPRPVVVPVAPRVVYAIEMPQARIAAAAPVESAPEALTAPPPPEEAFDPVHPGAITLITPPPIPEDTLLEEARSFYQRAELAMSERRPADALALYRSALDPARLYAVRPTADPAVKTELAILFRKLGSLQTRLASTAEARATLHDGRRILLGLAARKQWNPERARLLDDFDSGLRRLPRD